MPTVIATAFRDAEIARHKSASGVASSLLRFYKTTFIKSDAKKLHDPLCRMQISTGLVCLCNLKVPGKLIEAAWNIYMSKAVSNEVTEF